MAKDQAPGAFPTGADYSEALRDTTLCFAHAAVAGGTVAMGPLRMPRAVSGNFGSVFRVTSASAGARGGEYAVKCFTRAVPDRLRRYRAIGAALSEASGEWRVEVEYVANGVLVGGRWYPVILMEWIEGTALIPWLESHLGDAAALLRLADRFARVVGDVEAAGFAHGDLQHGNLVVGAGGEVRLIDYDGMYVPSLNGLEAAELGHRNYQHPRRTPRDFGPGLDRFSAHVIHLALRTLARRPDLWRPYHEEGGEHLLLKGEDFAAPAASDRWAAIACAVPELSAEYARLAYWAARPLGEVEALGSAVGGSAAASARPRGLPAWLADAVAGGVRPGGVRDSGARPDADRASESAAAAARSPEPKTAASAPSAPAAPGSAAPGNGRPRSGPAASLFVPQPNRPLFANTSPTPSPSTGLGASPPAGPTIPATFRKGPSTPGGTKGRGPVVRPPTEFTAVPRRAVWGVRLLALVLPVLAVTVPLGFADAFGFFLLDAVPALVTLAGLPIAYRRLHDAYDVSPELMSRSAAMTRRDAADRELAGARERVRRRQLHHARAQEAVADASARHQGALASLTTRAVADRDAVHARLADDLRSVDQERRVLDSTAGRDELQALRKLQEHLLDEALDCELIPERIVGKGPLAALRSQGMVTAADFTRVTSAVPTTPQERDRAVVSGPNGRARIDDLTPAAARALQEWRDNLADDIRTRLPGSLPYDEAQRLYRKRGDRRLALSRKSVRMRTEALDELAAIDLEFEDGRRHLEDLFAVDSARVQAELLDAVRQAADAVAARDAAQGRLAEARTAVDGHQNLTFGRFLAAAWAGR